MGGSKLAKGIANLRKVDRQLKEHDKQHGLSSKAYQIELENGLRASKSWDDYYRTLDYYAPIHKVLLSCSKGALKGKHVLDIGAASGIYSRFLQDKGVISVPFDLRHDYLRVARGIGNKRALEGDARTRTGKKETEKQYLPFKDNKFDFFVSSHFLLSRLNEFGESPNGNMSSLRTLGELHRVLKPRGIGVIYDVREVMSKSLRKNIEKLGFEILEKVSGDLRKETRCMLVLRKK